MSDFRQFVESIPTRELPPGYSVGEFGVGSYPFPPSPTVIEDLRHRPNLAWSFDNGKSYTGVDAGIVPPGHEYLGDVGYVRELAERRLNEYAARVAERRPQENIRFLFADATDQNLDIEPDELLMFNLL